MNGYKFAILDPRNIPAATAANDAIFASGSVYGIEVTVPALERRCTFNLDPQHKDGDVSRAAIEVALTWPLPPEGSTLATVRPDLDAIGSMAIFNLRSNGKLVEVYGEADWQYELESRVNIVATADKFARGSWPGRKALPTRENPWDEETASAESSRPLAAIAAAVADFKVPLADRVVAMERWLLTGEEPQQYRAKVEVERRDMITALEGGQVKIMSLCSCPACSQVYLTTNTTFCPICGAVVDPFIEKRISVVETTHRAATQIGYCIAPVVLALNPKFRIGGGDEHAKFTVCQYEPGHCDLSAVLAELLGMEEGWGGSPNIIGSPQGKSSCLTQEHVTEIIARHLK